MIPEPSSDSAGAPPQAVEFVCNICSETNRQPHGAFAREAETCKNCGSTVRWRSIIHALSQELFGIHLTLQEFPTLKGLRGLGLSDWSGYAERLAQKLDYTNTYYDREPRFDIVNPSTRESGLYDFIIASEVFEHVAPPVERAFENACHLLKPNGILLLSVPYTLEPATTEHYPELHQYALAQVAGRLVLVNQTPAGRLEVFDNLVFHGVWGATLEIRRFSEQGLRTALGQAGFRGVQFYGENVAEAGIVHMLNWSLPLAARKEPFVVDRPKVADILDQMRNWQAANIEARDRIKELEQMLVKKEEEHQERTRWTLQLETQLQERTEWALKLQTEVKELRAHLDWLTGAAWTRLGRFLRLLTLRSTRPGD